MGQYQAVHITGVSEKGQKGDKNIWKKGQNFSQTDKNYKHIYKKFNELHTEET